MSKVFCDCPSHDCITSATLLGDSLFNIESLLFVLFSFLQNFVMMIKAVKDSHVGNDDIDDEEEEKEGGWVHLPGASRPV